MKTQDALIKTDSKELIIDYIAFFISKPVWTNRACNATFVGAIKTNVKSIAESMILVFNNLNSDVRPIGNDILNDEMFVTQKGPEIGECDNILRKALDLHFSKTRLGVHFKTNNLFNTAGPTVVNVLKRI